MQKEIPNEHMFLAAAIQYLPTYVHTLGRIVNAVEVNKTYTLLSYIVIVEKILYIESKVTRLVQNDRVFDASVIQLEQVKFLEGVTETVIREVLGADSLVLLLKTLWDHCVIAQSCCAGCEQVSIYNMIKNDVATFKIAMHKKFKMVALASEESKAATTSDPVESNSLRRERTDAGAKETFADVAKRQKTMDSPPPEMLPPIQLLNVVPVTSASAQSHVVLFSHEMELIKRCYNFIKGSHFWKKEERFIPLLTFTPLESIMVVLQARARMTTVRNNAGNGKCDDRVAKGLPDLFPETRPDNVVQVTAFQWKKFEDEVEAFFTRIMAMP